MNNFIDLIKKTRDIKTDDAENAIIKTLMVQNKRQSEKLDGLNTYDSESLFNGKIYRGNINQKVKLNIHIKVKMYIFQIRCQQFSLQAKQQQQ